MAIQIESTTDSEENTLAAMGGKATEQEQMTLEAESGESADENESEESATSETEGDESEESQADDDSEEKAAKKGEKNDSEDEDEDDSDDESEESDESEDDDEDEKPQKRRRRKSGFQRRVEKLNKRIADKEREIEYWRQQALKEGSGQEADSEEPEAKAKADTSDKPQSDDFESHEDYLEALVEWKAEQKLKERESQLAEQKAKSEQEQLVNAHNERVQKFMETHDDFMDVLEEVDDVQMPFHVQEVILQSDNGPELMYNLGLDRDSFEKICELNPVAAARELGRFEAKIESKSKSPSAQKKQARKTRAPKPIRPVGSKSSKATTKSIYDPDISQAEYERLRAEGKT